MTLPSVIKTDADDDNTADKAEIATIENERETGNVAVTQVQVEAKSLNEVEKSDAVLEKVDIQKLRMDTDVIFTFFTLICK